MRPILGGKIIFVFSDPGGAKPCLSLIELDKVSDAFAVSDRIHSFFSSFNTQVKILDRGYEEYVDSLNPELIFTGTSYTSSIEQEFIKIALRKKIPCFSFVDHWTLFSKRFTDIEGKMVLPDKVWVLDDRAKSIAIDEGIDNLRLVVTGNPYHDWLKDWKPQVTKDEFLSVIGQSDLTRKLLIYAPDPLSNINGKELYGFDEYSATGILVELFDTYQKELEGWQVLVKLHPNQNKSKFSEIISDRFIILPDDVDVNSTIYFADAVMGFFSSFLIEASIMNKTVFRFLYNTVKQDPIAELNIGIVLNRKTFVESFKNY
jgi:hypothetical protein